ncbi:Glutathione S-transferase L1 [Morella rubra]|uniref:Glutathione S-transferase L1 n=1 Tax=Morella rubra TaxID=262757 RepID=A0A6A1WFD8_9ROSI|nr:Glutathione S-transferase L1 [Morella rubra]
MSASNQTPLTANPLLLVCMSVLYISYTCPFAQRVWITRNYKGLQEKIELVPINLQNRPAWYKEKLYPENKVPSLEHNGKIIGESLDLIKYVDSNFEGPSLLPNDPAKREFAEELIAYTDTFNKTVFTSFKGDPVKEVEVWKYDITAGRPKLAKWIEVEQLEQEVAELKQVLAEKREQETAMLQLLMRVEQEQRVTEDARISAEQDAAAQRYTVHVLEEKYEKAMASLAEKEKRVVIAESMLEATLQYESGQSKALSSPRYMRILLA